MSAKLIIPHHELIEIPSPYPEPRIAYQDIEPRKASNLTLIDGKTFLSTNPSGDIMPPGAPDVGFFHDDTRFLSRLELRMGGHSTGLLSSGSISRGGMAPRAGFEPATHGLTVRCPLRLRCRKHKANVSEAGGV